MRYIITSSLNIDNILSTESISPVGFYGMRSFGYNKFIQIDELRDYEYILLFSEIPNFEIRDEQRENHPMVIQVDDEEQFANTVMVGDYLGCKVYACSKTIRINPLNSTILFFSNKARILSIQNCIDSKLCKLVDYFHFQVVKPSTVQLNEIVKSISKDVHLSVQTVKDDNQYDRVKGFIYGYYIGATRSISGNAARMLAIQKRIYDIIASIKSNGGRSNPAIDKEIQRLDQEYTSLDPNIACSKECWKEFAEKNGNSVDNLNKILHILGVESEAKRNFCRNRGITLRYTLSEYAHNDLEKYCEDISIHVKSIISHERIKNRENINLCSLFDINPDYSLAMMAGTDVDDYLFNKILNYITWNNIVKNLEELRINRFEITTQVTKIVRRIIEESGEKWDGSIEQLFFHHLRQNMKEFTPFNLQEINNIIFQSLAAFLLKGEDFDALINYLENNYVSSYQYALALWGATLGYVQIPRTILFSCMSKKTFAELYKDVYNLMHKNALKGDFVVNANGISIKENPSDKRIASQEEECSIVWEAWTKVRKGLKNRDKLEENLKSILNESEKNEEISSLLEKLDKNVWKRGNQPWQKLHKQLGLVYDVQKQKKTSKCAEKNVTLFDIDVRSLKSLNGLPKSALDRLLSNWNYTAKREGLMTDEHIKFFLNLCKKEGRGGSEHKELKDLFTEDLANRILNEINELRGK